MKTYNFSNFPKAAVAFGENVPNTDHERLQKNLAVLKKFVDGASQALRYGQQIVPNLKIAALIAGKFDPVMTVLVFLVGEVDELYKELKNLEHKIFNTILEGKLRALKRNVSNLRDTNTSDVQKVAEIVSAITNLDELLPLFSNKDSIFRERYYSGAPLFCRFCAILKAICLIAEESEDYNSSNLQSLKEDYQKMLDWYRIKCIGRRMASCYTEPPRPSLPGDETWIYDWERHYKLYKKYYEENPLFPWSKYGEKLGGKWWDVGHGITWNGTTASYYKLVDTWDTRPHEKVKFEPLELTIGISEMPMGFCYYLLAEYRQRVEKVMLEYFNEFSLITSETELNVG